MTSAPPDTAKDTVGPPVAAGARRTARTPEPASPPPAGAGTSPHLASGQSGDHNVDDLSQRVPGDVVRRGLGVLWQGVREQPRVFAISVVGSALWAGMTVLSAVVIGAVTSRVILPDIAAGRTTASALGAAALAIVGVALVKAVGVVARRAGAGVMQYRLQAAYRREVTRQYLRLPLSWHARHPTGQLLSNANADVEAIWYPIAPFPFAVGVIVMLLVSGVALVLTDPVLAVVGFLIFPAVAVLNIVYNRRLSPLATRAQQLRASVSGVAHESFDGALVVKTLGRETDETARFGEEAARLRDALVRVGRVRGLFDPVLEALPNVGILAVLMVGTLRLEAGAIDAGELVRVAYLFTLLAFPIRGIGWVLSELPRSVVGWDRVQGVLTARGATAYGGSEPPPGEQPSRLELTDVGYAYADGPAVLAEVGLTIEPGRTIAVVGPTGAGKSTLASLLVRLMDPTVGTITLDGALLPDLRRGGVAASAALVPQSTFLFDDTVRGNVTLGADVRVEEVRAALRLAQAEAFVDALPRGLDTVVGERGTTLSGGQRQRVALARALVRRPRLLVLDDATSSVDPHVEQAILTGLRDAALPSTVVVVAYRRATIALADEVVWVERGRVVARGPHERLLATVPSYAALVTAYDEEPAGAPL